MLKGFDDRSDQVIREIGRIFIRPLQFWLFECLYTLRFLQR